MLRAMVNLPVLTPTPHADDGRSDRLVWTLQLLGGLRLESAGQTMTRLPSRATTVLLARLALAPTRLHPREELIELLWPGVDLPVGRNRLRQALSTLRALLEPPGAPAVLRAERLGIALLPARVACDVTLFERACRSGDALAGRSLYRGELLPGLYDDWVIEERGRLEALAERLPAATGPAPSPSSSPAPAPIALPTGPLTRWPVILTRYFDDEGRREQLRTTVREHRLVTLLGPGGAGKTRLAIEALARPSTAVGSDDWPFEQVWFAPLASCEDVAALHDAIAQALSLPERAGDLPPRVAQQASGARPLLLVMDNFEQLVPQGVASVVALLSAVPQLHVLVTSRRLLGIDGEREWRLQQLGAPPPDAPIDRVAANAAVALFVDRARAARADFHLSARNAATLAHLVAALDGLPLAIELAASRVRTLAPAEMLDRLQARRAPAGDGGTLGLLQRAVSRGVEPRHASMTGVVRWSWEQLPLPVQQLLQAAAVFDGAFTVDALAAVARALPAAPQDTDAGVDEAMRHSLLQPILGRDDKPSRFALAEPVREFALGQTDQATRRVLRAAHRQWCLGWARSFGTTPVLAQMHVEKANLVAAMASALADAVPADALELAAALRPVLSDTTLPLRAYRMLDDAVRALPRHPLAGPCLTLLGMMAWDLGLRERAVPDCEKGLAASLPGSIDRARALHALASVRWRTTRRAEGLEPLLTEALALAAHHGHAGIQASVCALRAFVGNATTGDRVAAEALHRQALQLWEQHGNHHAVLAGHYNVAVCAFHRRGYQECLARLETVVRLAREGENWQQVSQALNVKGNTQAALREWPAAHAAYLESAEVAWASRHGVELAYALWNVGRAVAHLRQPEAAARLMAFAARHWQSRFGELDTNDRRELARVERLVRSQIGSALALAAADAGRLLTLPAAMQLLRDP